jgi:hypothetical protein
MRSIRCTCIYRTSSPLERAAGAGPLSLTARDPWCPADDVHLRVGHAEAVSSDERD